MLRSALLPNPYSSCASSRTTRWVNRVTRAPVSGSAYRVLMGTSIS
ncbi:Uncharacterised protein [Bordetella pertussis]|nr:Uncharacterised protein [Bordetella pertussis]